MNGIQADLSCTPQISIADFKALCLDVFVPGVFMVLIKVIVGDFQLQQIVPVGEAKTFRRFLMATTAISGRHL